MTEIEQIWQDDAIERMADNDRVINEQAKRIEVLEFHFEKLRALLFLGYTATTGIVPIVPVMDTVQKKVKRK